MSADKCQLSFLRKDKSAHIWRRCTYTEDVFCKKAKKVLLLEEDCAIICSRMAMQIDISRQGRFRGIGKGITNDWTSSCKKYSRRWRAEAGLARPAVRLIPEVFGESRRFLPGQCGYDSSPLRGGDHQ